MSIGTANAERVDADSPIAARWPLLWLDRHLELLRLEGYYLLSSRRYSKSLIELTLGVWLGEFDVGRNCVFLKSQNSLDQTSKARSALRVSNIGLDLQLRERSVGYLPLIRVFIACRSNVYAVLAENVTHGNSFQGITHWRPGTMALLHVSIFDSNPSSVYIQDAPQQTQSALGQDQCRRTPCASKPREPSYSASIGPGSYRRCWCQYSE